MNSLPTDPWLDDLWHDPFSWGHRSPWSISSSPWGSGLSILGPSFSVGRNEGFPVTRLLGRNRCQRDVAEKKEHNNVHVGCLDV